MKTFLIILWRFVKALPQVLLFPVLLAIAMAGGGNQGPFGEKNFFIPDGHWAYDPSRECGRTGAGGGMLDVGSGGR